jgi:phage terminase Nu1 subunit (DNA packaging protein)
MASVNGEQLAGSLNVPFRKLPDLVREGMPQLGRNKYELGQCFFWFVRHLQKELERRDGAGRSWIGKLEECASELNLGARRVQQLAKEGLPKKGTGLYDVIACFRWYVRYLQRKLVERALPDGADGDPGGPLTSATMTRNKMLSIDAELKEMELAEKREQLVPIEKVQKDLEAIVIEIRTRILALPPRVAAEVVGETELAVSQVKIERLLKGALSVLSQFDPG